MQCMWQASGKMDMGRISWTAFMLRYVQKDGESLSSWYSGGDEREYCWCGWAVLWCGLSDPTVVILRIQRISPYAGRTASQGAKASDWSHLADYFFPLCGQS